MISTSNNRVPSIPVCSVRSTNPRFFLLSLNKRLLRRCCCLRFVGAIVFRRNPRRRFANRQLVRQTPCRYYTNHNMLFGRSQVFCTPLLRRREIFSSACNNAFLVCSVLFGFFCVIVQFFNGRK